MSTIKMQREYLFTANLTYGLYVEAFIYTGDARTNTDLTVEGSTPGTSLVELLRF